MIQKWSAADGKSSCQHYCGTYNSVRRGDRLVHLKLSFVLEGRFFLSSINTPHIQPPPSRLQAGGRECVPRVHATRTTSLPPLQTTLAEQGGERVLSTVFVGELRFGENFLLLETGVCRKENSRRVGEEVGTTTIIQAISRSTVIKSCT